MVFPDEGLSVRLSMALIGTGGVAFGDKGTIAKCCGHLRGGVTGKPSADATVGHKLQDKG